MQWEAANATWGSWPLPTTSSPHVAGRLREEGDRFVVRTSDGEQYEARLIVHEVGSRTALLRVGSGGFLGLGRRRLQVEPYVFARDQARQGQEIHSVMPAGGPGADGLDTGRIDAVESAASPDGMSVSVAPRPAGAPLFNGCGEVVGMLRGDGPGGALAAPGSWLFQWVGEHDLAPARAAVPCAVDEARALAAAAAGARATAETRAAEAEEAAGAAAAARAAAEARAAAATTAAAEQQAAAETARQQARAQTAAAAAARREAEQQAAAARQQATEQEAAAAAARLDAEQQAAARLDAERQAADAAASRQQAEEQAAAEVQARRQYLLWAAIAVGVTSVVAFVIWVASRRSVARTAKEKLLAENRAQEAQAVLADRAARDEMANLVPAVFLDGGDADRPIAVRIPGNAIAAESGAVVGRNPLDSTIVLDHEEVSRRHFRLFARGDSVMIEDLDSTNGTKLNEVALRPGQSTPLESGTRLQVGGLAFTVHM